MTTFAARYGGKCASCGEGVRVDDLVRYADDSLIHDTCREPIDPLAVTATPCRTCFMVPAANGECGCAA